MKKVLLAGTALLSIAAFSHAASAEVKLDLGGYFRGYAVYADNDEDAADGSLRSFDFRRDSEIHFTGETTLDNGLTVGFHAEQGLGGAVQTDEVYGYFSGGWGRVNFGSEDGAAYLLQVAAPSADSNVDGLRVYIQGLNPDLTNTTTTPGGVATATSNSGAFSLGALDYDQADFRQTDRITYLTPKFSGFQAGISYAPENGQNAVGNNIAGMALDTDGISLTDMTAVNGTVTTAGVAQYEDLWEASVRWDGEFQGFGISLGAGYSNSDIEQTPTSAQVDALAAGDFYLNDGIESWNVGANVAFSGFSVGGAFLRSTTERIADTNVGGAVAATAGDITRDTWVVGAAWDNGPYHVGASYLDQQTDFDAIGAAAAATDIPATQYEADKFTIGAGYSFGPGMTFRGAVAWGEFDGAATATTDNDFTQVTLGTDIQF